MHVDTPCAYGNRRHRSTEVATVRAELAKYKKQVASQANYARYDTFCSTDDHGLSAVPAVALVTFTTAAAVSARWQVGSPGITVLRSIAASRVAPGAVRQAACMAANAFAAHTMAVSVGLTTGFGAQSNITNLLYWITQLANHERTERLERHTKCLSMIAGTRLDCSTAILLVYTAI